MKSKIFKYTLCFSYALCVLIYPIKIVSAQDVPVSSPIEVEEEIMEVAEEQLPPSEELKEATAEVEEILETPHEDNFFIVKFKDTEAANAENVVDSIAPDNAVDPRLTGLLGENVRLIKIDSAEEQTEQMIQFKLNNSVEYVETNQILSKNAWTVTSTTAKPNDFNNANHWYHLKSKVPEEFRFQNCGAGDECGGSSDVLVAVLDTGLAFETNSGATYREYLGGSSYTDRTPLNFTAASEMTGVNLWTNSAEDYGGGDEDGNFICDDLHGADMIAYVDNLSLLNASQWSDECIAGTSWVTKEGHPNDDDGHGTYVTNLIASATDNSASSFGVAFKSTIMPIKVLDYTGTGTTFTIAQGIRYAVNKGAKLVNISIAGLTSPSATLEDAIAYARDAGVVLIISSGNHGTTSSSLEYPAAYANTYWNVISVGASTNTDTRASYSNYGTGLDLVAAVGVGASAGNATYGQTFNDADSWAVAPLVGRSFTTYANKYWIGTSFAAPQVTAAAALMKAVRPDLTKRIKQILQGTTIDIAAGGYDTQTGYGLLDVKAAVDAALIDEGEFPGGTSKINSIKYNNKIYQVVKSQSDRVYIRSFNGSVWSEWEYTNGGTPGEVSLAVFNNKLYMTIRGGSTNIYVNTIDTNNVLTGWSLSVGQTPSDISSFVSQNRLYQALRGNSGYVFIRWMIGTTWSSWLNTNGETPGLISLIDYNNTLYLTIRGGSTSIFTNTFNGSTLSGWTLSGGETPGEISSIIYNNRIYQAIRGNSGGVFVRSFNGTWSSWLYTLGDTSDFINMEIYNSRLYFSIRGGSTSIYTNSFNGTSYSGWVNAGGETASTITIIALGSKLYQFMRGGSGSIYMRNFNGSTWTTWENVNGNIDLT